MFHKARLKLTLWYLLIIMFVSIMFSVSIYRILTNELDREAHRISTRYEQEFGITLVQVKGTLEPEIIQASENRILFSLIYVNIVILAVAGVGGFILAGLTLKPIKQMLDEQDRFIADASHELRTPLTALKSEIEVYLRAKKTSIKDANILIKSNLEEVNKLQYLSDNLIQLTKGMPQENPVTEVSLSEALNAAIINFEKPAKQKKISVKSSAKDFVVLGNKDSFMQLFGIILENAIKYSPEKSAIFISTKRVDNSVQVSIKDTGMGIAKKDIEHIFDRFYRSDISRTKQKISGYGLGLSIAKNITDSYHGSISVESTEGKGSKFTIQLPLKK